MESETRSYFIVLQTKIDLIELKMNRDSIVLKLN